MIHPIRFSGFRAGALPHALVAALLIFVLAVFLLMQTQVDLKKSDKIAQKTVAAHRHKKMAEKPVAGSPVLMTVPPDRVLPADSDRLDDSGDTLPLAAMRRLGSTRLRSGGAVSALLFTADSSVLIAADENRFLSWWDVATGREIRRIPAWHLVGSMFLLPDGERFVTTGRNESTFLIRRISDGKLLYRLIGGSWSGKSEFACSPDQRLFASTTVGNEIQLWDAVTGKPVRRLKGLSGRAGLILFSSDSSNLSAFLADGSYSRWDLASGNVSDSGNAPMRGSFSTASENGLLATVHNGRASIFELHNFSQVIQLPGGVQRAVVSPSGARFASGGSTGITVWDADTSAEIASFSVRGQYLRAIGFSPDDKFLAAGNSDGLLRIWSLGNNEELCRSPAQPGAVKSLVFAGDGTKLLSICANGYLQQWDLITGEWLSSDPIASSPYLLKALDQDRVLVLAAGRLIVWSLKNMAILAQAGSAHFSGVSSRCPVAVSRDGMRAVLAARKSTQRMDSEPPASVLQVWDTEKISLQAELNCPERLAGLALSPDGKKLAVTTSARPGSPACEGQNLFCYELDSGRHLFTSPIPTSMSYMSMPIFTPAGHLMVAGGSYTQQQIIASSGERVSFISHIGLFAGHEQISPDNARLARLSWGDSSNVIVGSWWEGRDLKGHRGWVRAVAFSHGGRYLASGGQDSTILLWDLYAAESHMPDQSSLSEQRLSPAEAVELPAEAPINALPVLHLAFEDVIAGPPLAVTTISESVGSHFHAEGRVGRGLSLSAAERCPVTLNEAGDFELPDGWTVEFWFLLDQKVGEEALAYMRVFDCGLMNFVINRDGRPAMFYRLSGGGHGHLGLMKNNVVAPGQWYHLAVAWDKPAGKLRAQLNGAIVAELPRSNLATVIGPLSFGLGSGKSPVNRVVIDELKIYRHARAADEIAGEVGYGEAY
ncbi:MAG: hypothetical protein CVV41_04365 [Candidatus Riflebacteria bacterium HGW-Riflebacteria-1]|jgi:WD40 repeat protein|nr:MAG: hypothetical protein CVV41_04365 [Candidatus Riflebacteria bacterium HGW-Riflebacteria-1]